MKHCREQLRANLQGVHLELESEIVINLSEAQLWAAGLSMDVRLSQLKTDKDVPQRQNQRNLSSEGQGGP